MVAGSRAELDRWWERTLPVWHFLYLGLLSLAAVTTIMSGGFDTAEQSATVALLGVMAVAYLKIGRWLFDRPGGTPAAVYLSITWLCFHAVLLITEGNTAAYFLLFALFPQVWAYLRPRWAAVTSIVVVIGQALAEIYVSGWSWESAVQQTPIAIMQAGLVLLIGLLMVGVVKQAENRAAVIDELAATRTELAETERERGTLAERERLAHEIHDTLAQGFTSILTLAQAIDVAFERDPGEVRERLALLERTARESLAETRSLIDALAPVDLQHSTFAEAIDRVAARFSTDTGIPVDVQVDGDPPTLPLFAEVVLLRVLQEALTNVRRHAQASRVQVTLSSPGGDSLPRSRSSTTGAASPRTTRRVSGSAGCVRGHSKAAVAWKSAVRLVPVRRSRSTCPSTTCRAPDLASEPLGDRAQARVASPDDRAEDPDAATTRTCSRSSDPDARLVA